MKNVLKVLLWPFILLPSLCEAAAGGLTPAELEEIASEASYNENVATLQPRLELAFDLSKTVSQRSDAELRSLFEAAYVVSFYGRPRDMLFLRDLLLALESRGLALPIDRNRVVGELVQWRLLDDARALSRDPLSIPVEVLGRGSSLPWRRVWEIGDDNRVVRTSVPSSENLELVVLGHPSCGFTRNFIDSLEKNKELSRALRNIPIIWLAAADSEISFDSIYEWNKSHPRIKFRVAYAMADWPFVDDIAYPGFYFLRNGRLVFHTLSWPKGDSGKRLIDAAKLLRSESAIGD